MAEKATYLSVIKNAGFRHLWFNQILVQLAYNILNFALIVWVYKLANSNIAVSALMLSIYLPSVVFGIFAGVFVDIVDRKKLIILIDLLLALSFLIFVFIKQYYPLILINAFIINSLAQFFMPSESSSIPMLVSKRQLFLANSLFSLTLYGAIMVGYSIGGPLLNTFGLNSIFILGSFMLIGAYLAAKTLPKIKVIRKEKEFDNLLSFSNIDRVFKITKKETLVTFRFIRGKLPITFAILLLVLVQGVVGVLAVMMPSYMEKVLHIHATDASYFVMLPLGLGMVVGAFIVGKFFQRFPKRTIVIPGIIAAGILLILVAVVPTIARLLGSPELSARSIRPRYFFRAPSLSSIFAIGAFLMGFFTVFIIIPCQTVLQENTTEQNRGKIFATLGMLMTAFAVLPIAMAGGLSDLFGVTPIFLILGFFILIVGVLALRPAYFFAEHHLPFRFKEFLGLGHWEK